MSKTGYKAVSLPAETANMLLAIGETIESQTGVELNKLPQIIKFLAKEKLKGEVNATN